MDLVASLRRHLNRSFDLWLALVDSLPGAALRDRLPGLPSNRIGSQLWCVVGARESYTRALAAGEWSGFACSLSSESCFERDPLRKALADSASGLLTTLAKAEPLVEARADLVLDLLEHEAAHQGQIVRYLYGLRLPIPEAWQERYALRPLTEE